MAEHQVASALQEEQWSGETVFIEYQRRNRFSRYTGPEVNNIFVVVQEYQKDRGDQITVPFIDQLEGDGAKGNAALDGNEEDMSDNGHQITLDWRRNAVKFSKKEKNKTRLNLEMIAKQRLTQWCMEQTRGGTRSSSQYIGIIDALTSVTGTVTLASATAAQKNTFAGNNEDRLLFGSAKSNYSATFSTALGNVDSTNDKMTAAVARLAKEMAEEADPAISPYRTEDDDEEWFVMFHNSRAWRDLMADGEIAQVNREAWQREAGKGNPLFTGGSVIYEGIIHRKIPEIPFIEDSGAGSIDVGQSFLCGVGAAGMAIGQRPRRTQSDNTDYGFRKGVGIEELIGIEKLFRGDKQNGVVTVYTSGVAST